MNIYAIPGLGADQRVFQFQSLKIHPIQWIQTKKNESFQNYVQRLIPQINTTEPFVLLGVSFGGMVAIELNKYIQPEKTIIISSSASKEELPLIVKVIGKTNINRITPDFLLKIPSFLVYQIFGVRSQEGKTLLKTILQDTDIEFLKWAIDKIIHWKRGIIPANLFRIHGTRDKLLKMKKGIKYEVIEGGGHFMIVEQAGEVEKVIKRLIYVI